MTSVLLPRDRNLRVGMLSVLIALAMLALGFAAVPLYRIFCQVTGFGGTTMRSATGVAPGEVVGKLVNVRFDSNVSPSLPWRFVRARNTIAKFRFSPRTENHGQG